MKDRIQALRQAVIAILREHGDEGFPRPLAGAVVVNGAGQVLLGAPAPWGQRGLHSPNAAVSQVPTGGVDEGETSLEAAIREAYEEGHVTAVPVPGTPAFLRIAQYPSTDPLGFGSPRLEQDSEVISQAAADLLLAAARRCGLEGLYPRERLGWFDALARGMYVPWRYIATFHVLALMREETFVPGRRDEWCCRGWAGREELHELAGRDPSGRMAFLLRKGLEEWLGPARQLSRLVDGSHPLVSLRKKYRVRPLGSQRQKLRWPQD